MSDPDKAGLKLQRSSIVRDASAFSSVEYVIILILLTAIAVAAWKTFGENAQTGRGGAPEPNGHTHLVGA